VNFERDARGGQEEASQFDRGVDDVAVLDDVDVASNEGTAEDEIQPQEEAMPPPGSENEMTQVSVALY
jgi:hypothetical protein